MKNQHVVIGLSLLLVAAALPLSADQVTFGPSTNPIYFCAPTGGGNINVAATAFADTATCTGATTNDITSPGHFFFTGGPLFGLSGIVSVTFPGPSPLMLIGPPNGFGQFATNGVTSAFSFDAGANGTVTGTIHYNMVVDNTPNPRFDGSVTIASNTAAAGSALAQDYPVNSVAHIDWTMNTTLPVLDDLFLHGGNTSATISSGQLTPAPEPTSIFFLGTGILAAGTLLRRRHNRA